MCHSGLFLILIAPSNITLYSLRPNILVIKMDKRDVSRCILVLDTSLFVHFDEKYFRTEGV